jgi:two-component system sensor histidine kinase KdpD
VSARDGCDPNVRSMIDDKERPEPESFLDLVPSRQKGRLKVYIGAAAGVGKTHQMLEEAHQLKERGVDVVLGVIETHGRAQLNELIEGLEAVPLREVQYRGITLKEMDLDALLVRKPEVAIVDELAHTNAPGSRHAKRYQDVEELVANGINVITAVNVQHVESLNPLVRDITGVQVRETVPDSFFARASEIVTVDLSAEELRARLRDGKIYPPSQIEQALKSFFRSRNLAALRELALHEVARVINRKRRDQGRLGADGAPPPVAERLMVCLSSNPPNSKKLLHKAARLANQLEADWEAVYVETPAESVKKISTKDFRALLDNIELVQRLGGDTVWLKSADVVRALLDYARDNGVTKIIIGRSREPFWKRWFRGSIPMRLVAEARGIDVEIIDTEDDEKV